MNQPTWLSDNLAAAAYLVQIHAQEPITIVATASCVTLCTHSGETFQLPPLQLEPGNTTSSTQDNSQLGQVTPASPEHQVIEASPAPQTGTTIPEDHTSPTQLSNQAAPETQTRAERLANDLNMATRAEPPTLAQPEGTIEDQFRAHARRLALEDRKTRKDRHLQLHLAYALGQLYNGHRRTIHRYLPRLIQEERQRRRLISAITRTHRLVERCGLPRIYGSTQLTLADIRAMRTDEFAEDFLATVHEEVVSLEDWDSEGFVSSVGGNVTP